MAKFRKKPVEIEAVQWSGEWSDVIAWLSSLPSPDGFLVPFGGKPGIVRGEGPDELELTTVHGEQATARVGDWIIAEPVRNRFYPCKPDIFSGSYERVSD